MTHAHATNITANVIGNAWSTHAPDVGTLAPVDGSGCNQSDCSAQTELQQFVVIQG